MLQTTKISFCSLTLLYMKLELLPVRTLKLNIVELALSIFAVVRVKNKENEEILCNIMIESRPCMKN